MTNIPQQKHTSGNAPLDGAARRGWFMGGFIPQEEPFRHTNDVEVKWANHRAGETRDEWSAGDSTHTISILISGAFRIIFEDTIYDLAAQGDYVIWHPFTPHTWEAFEDSTILTIRWPANEQGTHGTHGTQAASS